jgi:Rod binding domain-containing protein
VSEKANQNKPVAIAPPIDPAVLDNKLNRMSVKFNAKSMLDQEFGEALSDYIGTANQLIAQLKAELAKLQEEQKPKGKKE